LKTISSATASSIEDFAAETELSLPAYALEKDCHVLDAIKMVSAMSPSAHFRLVFCGGTCLSKAYGILDRMSEDVDFKVVPTVSGVALGTAALRRELSSYVKSIVAELEAGFGEGSVARRSRDDNKYSALDITYESAFDKPDSLRPHLLFELNHTTLADETTCIPIGALFDKLAHGAYAAPFDIECVSLREALAEKMVSFPRRLALQLSKMQPGEALGQSGDWDKALVRHIYDVDRILEHHPEFILHPELTKRLIATTISKDAGEFANQHPAFAEQPRKELEKAMTWAKASKALRQQYGDFVADMVYAPAGQISAYDRSTLLFESMLIKLLAFVPDQDLAPAKRPARPASLQGPAH
jgi:predicted nucleotidyltransferase component of viral defense system